MRRAAETRKYAVRIYSKKQVKEISGALPNEKSKNKRPCHFIGAVMLLSMLPVPALAAPTSDKLGQTPAVSQVGERGEQQAQGQPQQAGQQQTDGLPQEEKENTARTITIAEFAAVDGVSASLGMSLEDVLALLPSSMEATDSDGNRITIEGVMWTCDTYDAATGGEYTFTMALPEGYALARRRYTAHGYSDNRSYTNTRLFVCAGG
ncbi:MAG: hypothetical protein ACOYJC_05900 [Christensenellales bacterium]|jgi:hypothetical protein